MKLIMNEKSYKSITEVSEQLKINKHVIRYWDSKFQGISTRLSNSKRRFFSSENIKKIEELKNVLYKNGKHNYSLELANRLIKKTTSKPIKENIKISDKNQLIIEELEKISNHLKNLIKQCLKSILY